MWQRRDEKNKLMESAKANPEGAGENGLNDKGRVIRTRVIGREQITNEGITRESDLEGGRNGRRLMRDYRKADGSKSNIKYMGITETKRTERDRKHTQEFLVDVKCNKGKEKNCCRGEIVVMGEQDIYDWWCDKSV